MELKLSLNNKINLTTCLRQAGYHPITGSWVRTMGRGYYPRFHLYVSDSNLITPHLKCGVIKLSLHLDQKQHTIDIPGLKRHAGEYNSAIVQEEMGRLQRWINFSQQQQIQ